MKLDNRLFDKIQKEALASSRKRMHYDLRTQSEPEVAALGWKDTSQRMLNVLMPDTLIPIHRHNSTSETIIACRGSVRVELYDSDGTKVEDVVLEAGGDCPGIQVPKGVYHTCVCLKHGSVIFESKDRAYDPEGMETL